MTIAPPLPVMVQLREQTLEAHKSAESHPFQRDMASGRLPREKFIANLVQLFHLHRALDESLRAAAPAEPALRRVLRDHQCQTTYLEEDLRFFGVDPLSVPATPATARAIAAVRHAGATEPRHRRPH